MKKNMPNTKKPNFLQNIKNVFCGENHFADMSGQAGAPYLLPIRLTMIYLIFSVIVYIVCPFEWETKLPVLFYSLLILYFASLWAGYRVGLMNPLRTKYEWTEAHTKGLVRILSALTVLSFAVYIINIFRDYGFKTFDFVGIAKQMWTGVCNPGLGYRLRYERLKVLSAKDVVGGYAMSLFNYFWAFINYPIMIASMIFFRELKTYAKVFTVLRLVLTIFYYLSIGTTIDILTVFLLIELPIILETFTKWQKREMSKKQIVKLICTMIAGLLIVFTYFTWMMICRGGINHYDDPEYNVGGVGIDIGDLDDDIITDPEEPVEPGGIYEHVPPIVMKFWISFSSYLTQGYYAFSQALTLKWTPLFGLGSNMAIVDLVTKYFHDINQYTYQVKLEQFGWDSRIRWHSMFTWLANDVSFYGVILVMFAIGILFGAMFKDAIKGNNPFSKISIFYFILMILFIPCNNQIGQRVDTLFSFIFIIILWIVSKHPFPFVRKLLDRMAAKE